MLENGVGVGRERTEHTVDLAVDHARTAMPAM